ncbi:MAG: PHP domain-containing protein [Thermodesulfovibrionales bacterium]
MLIDMHIHTTFSPCSIISIPCLLKRAKEVGLDGICITDHNTVASKYAFDITSDNLGLSVIIGIEYTTAKGDFLVFGPVDNIPDDLDAQQLIRWVHKQKGVIIAAHPFRKYRSVDPNCLWLSAIIESINGRNLPHEDALCKDWLRKHGNGIREIGGSDAHCLEEVGHVVTAFSNNIYNVDDLIRELQCGEYFPLKRSSHSVISR